MDIDLNAILRTFRVEAEEHLTRMEESLLALENAPADHELLEAIFRGAHTIKGNAASLGFNHVAELAHAFEESLQKLRSHDAAVTRAKITLLLRSVDALRQMIPEAIDGATELSAGHRALLRQLDDDNETGSENQPLVAAPDQNHDRVEQSGDDFSDKSERAGSVRVDIQKLDSMLNLAGEIAAAHGRLRRTLGAAPQPCADAVEAHAQLERLSRDLQEQILKARMVPVGPIFRQCRRTVREVAQASGKAARLVIRGEDVEIDLGMVERLKDPLMHMLRNAVAHGIETADIRSAQGKDPGGLITLKASCDGTGVEIELIDDGAGLNRERIAARVRALGLAPEPERLSDQELGKFIFEPGFSTAVRVTDLSGRGVGMDVVRRNIESLHGNISVDSRAGVGTRMTIRLPLTLAIIDGFVVGVGDEIYILPLDTVLECIELPAHEPRRERGDGVIDLRGEPLPYIHLRHWFGLDSPRPSRENVAVVQAAGLKAGFAVDLLHGTRQTVIKPLGKRFQHLRGIAGSAILGSGRVALILDVPTLLREVIRHRAGQTVVQGNISRPPAAPPNDSRRPAPSL